MFGCPKKHYTDEPAGVDDDETWVCPVCHMVFKKQVENHGKLKN